MAFSEPTLNHLDGLGLVHEDRTINRKEAIVRLSAGLRKARCDDLEKVQDEALTVGEWREREFGDPGDELAKHELNLWVGGLLSISATGAVHQHLRDGDDPLVMCKVDVDREKDGETKHRRGAGRIASADADVVERWHDAVKAAELVRKGQTTRASFDLSGERIPELGRRHRKMLTRTSGEIEQLLLTAGDDDGAEDES